MSKAENTPRVIQDAVRYGAQIQPILDRHFHCRLCGGAGEPIGPTLNQDGPCHAGPYSEVAAQYDPGVVYCLGCGHPKEGVNCTRGDEGENL